MLDKKLKIDMNFKRLYIPLSKKEYLQLESDILKNGCTVPITIWNNIIVDGHDRYEICSKHNIGFTVKEINFDCREAVVVWICVNQLKLKNIPTELRKYLIGTQYEAEKILNIKRNIGGVNQCTKDILDTDMDFIIPKRISDFRSYRFESRIADENQISYGTVQKYVIYTRAIEEIGKKEPDLVSKILAGQYKISHINIIELSKLPAEDIKRINRKLEMDPAPFSQFKETRKVIKSRKDDVFKDTLKMSKPSVKDMPKYDPDAEISSLTLTIPSWKSSIERTRTNANLSTVSSEARKKVTGALESLITAAAEMIAAIEEEKWKT